MPSPDPEQLTAGEPAPVARRALAFPLSAAALLTGLAAAADVRTQPQLVTLYALWAVGTAVAGVWIGWSLRRSSSMSESAAPVRRATLPILLSVVAAGTFLRFFELDFGFPFYNHPDEGPKGEIVSRMIANGSFNPHYFLHPTLLLYLSRFLSSFFGLFPFDLSDVHRAILAGRTVSAAAGSASVLLVYFVAKRLLSRDAALIAAAILAFSPLHVTCSRYMKEDVLCVFFMLACLSAALKASQERRAGWLLCAGLLAGLSAASKYTGILSAAFVVLVPLLCPGRPHSFRTIAAALCAVPLGFLAGCPYALLSYDAFHKHFRTEQNHMRGGHHGVVIDAWSQWWSYHLSRSIAPGMQILPAALGILGIGVMLFISPPAAMMIGGGLLLFYMPAEWVKAKPPPQPERYILGCLPFLAIGAGAALTNLSRLRLRALAPVLCVAAVAFPAVRSIELARDLRRDTRQEMREWMLANLPAGTKLYIEASYSPRFRDTPFDVKLSKAMKRPGNFTRQRLLESGYEYLLVNSFSYDRWFFEPRTNAVVKKRFESIFDSFELVKEVSAPSGSYGFQNPVMRLYRISKYKG